MATSTAAKKTAKPRPPAEISAATKAEATAAKTTTSTSSTNLTAGSSDASATAANAVATGDAGIQALIDSFNQSLASLAISGRKSLITQRKALKAQTRAAAQERDAYLQQLQALNVAPAPGISSLSSPEVMQAQRQIAIDAAGRKGFRRSIIAGNTGPMGAVGSAASMAPSVPGGLGTASPNTAVFSGSSAARSPIIPLLGK